MTQPTPTQPTPIRALEFFCGIGGLHYGLQYSQKDLDDQGRNPIKVVAAFDINHSPLQTAIEKLTAKNLDKYKANTWLLSPPYARSKGLLHLIKLLPTLGHPPDFILLENVLNFEVSRSRDLLVSMLSKMGYEFEEWLLSPLQFGIPNDRKRYYLTAKRRIEGETIVVNDTDEEVQVDLKLKTEWEHPVPPTEELSKYLDKGLMGKIGGSTPHMPSSKHSAAKNSETNNVVGNDVEALKIPESFVKKRKFISDGYVVGPAEKKSACFTKAYGHHWDRCGIVFADKGIRYLWSSLFQPDRSSSDFTDFQFLLKTAGATNELGMTPFTFPPSTTLIQRYRVLGNSLNVVVIGELLKKAVFN
ncbi:S-adenosyl-L-methionine-dependent methyltransferase [Obelidium mucronatum]|nr:S-adenosyl-L-methionine-dependent methyltransferase [Obelidium mucronatum]